jgi:hypothetical protein
VKSYLALYFGPIEPIGFRVIRRKLRPCRESLAAEVAESHEHENGFEALFAINYVVDQSATGVLPFVQEDGRDWVVQENGFDKGCAVIQRPNRVALKSGLKVELVVLEVVNELLDGHVAVFGS